MISYGAFSKALLAIGRAEKVILNQTAAIPALLLELSFGSALNAEHKELTKRPLYKSSAQLCAQHTPEELTGKLMLAVLNFPRKQIGKELSDCLVTGVQKEGLSLEAKRATTIYVKPSRDVEPGLRVGILGEKMGPIQVNQRDCTWGEFLGLDLRIAEVLSQGEVKPVAAGVDEVLLRVRMAEGECNCMARIAAKGFDLEGWIGKQVLVLANLDEESKIAQFGTAVFGPVLCTVGGVAWLEPAKPVEVGYKLA